MAMPLSEVYWAQGVVKHRTGPSCFGGPGGHFMVQAETSERSEILLFGEMLLYFDLQGHCTFQIKASAKWMNVNLTVMSLGEMIRLLEIMSINVYIFHNTKAISFLHYKGGM